MNCKITLVIEILPTVKSRAFGINTSRKRCDKRLKGKELKTWAVGKANEILKERGDIVGQELISCSKKKDDHADVVLYCDAWYRFLHTGEFALQS